ncbi:hypothetical protein PF003_g12260 [Phytophthora fragariae]|nr:hypothetical protein PF003_g12260 [Phytophthora fragariae]
MVCLWAGKRNWTTGKRTYKQLLAATTHEKSAKRAMAKSTAKWDAMSPEVAKGLAHPKWGSIRRIVGLNPWGGTTPATDQAPRPFSLQSCLRRPRVSAPSVHQDGQGGPTPCFLDVSGSRQLRHQFIALWASAGLSLDEAEEAVFSLQLPAMPNIIMAELGQFIADQPDSTAEMLGDSVEKILDGC